MGYLSTEMVVTVAWAAGICLAVRFIVVDIAPQVWAFLFGGNIHDATRVKVEAFAELATNSYRQMNDTNPVEKKNWRFHLLSFNGSISLWKCDRQPRNHEHDFDHVVVIRGTKYASDWINRNRHLISGTAGCGENFRREVESYREFIREILQEYGLTSNSFTGMKPRKVMLCGHSLGASLAEAIFARDKDLFCGAITFDSPGQPASYRERPENGFPSNHVLNGVWTVNNTPNVVNTLNAPCASRLWTCSASPTETVDVLVGAFSRLLLKATLSALWNVFLKNTETHQMDKIRDNIRDKLLLRVMREKWPTISGSALQVFANSALTEQEVPIERTMGAAAGAAPAQQRIVRDTRTNTGLKNVPRKIRDFALREVYEISTPQKFNELFTDRGQLDFVVIPLVGRTAQGKTGTFARLVYGDSPIPDAVQRLIGGGYNGVDNSVTPLIALWKREEQKDGTRCVLLLDLPGIGGNIVPAWARANCIKFFGCDISFADFDSYSALLTPIRSNVRCIVNITRAAHVDKAEAKMWAKLSSETENAKIVVAYNCPASLSTSADDYKTFTAAFNTCWGRNSYASSVCFCVDVDNELVPQSRQHFPFPNLVKCLTEKVDQIPRLPPPDRVLRVDRAAGAGAVAGIATYAATPALLTALHAGIRIAIPFFVGGPVGVTIGSVLLTAGLGAGAFSAVTGAVNYAFLRSKPVKRGEVKPKK